MRLNSISTIWLVSLLAVALLLGMVPMTTAQPQIERLRFQVTVGLDAQLIGMLTEDIHVLTQLTRTGDIEMLDQEGFTITAAPGFHIGFIGFNIRPDQAYRGQPEVGPVLSDVNFRHALYHAFNKPEIVADLYAWIATPVNSLVPPTQGGWVNPDVPLHPYNPGDPEGNTVWDPETGENEDACSILRYGGYLYGPAHGYPLVNNWATPYDIDGDGTPGTDGAPGAPATTITDIDDVVPVLNVVTPTFEVDPHTAEIGATWVDDLNDIGLTSIVNQPIEFWLMRELVYENHDFDIYLINFKLNRFPDHLYDWLHSSQDFPGGYNAFGINDPVLDGYVETLKYSLSHTEKMEASYAAQERLADPEQPWGLPAIPVYTMIYFDAFNPDLRGIVNSPGFGSNDGGSVALKEPDGPTTSTWTYLNMHWEPGTERIDPDTGDTLIIWCLSDFPEGPLNPLWPGTVFDWEIMDRIYDPLIMVNPYTHADLQWIASDWNVEETPDGMDVTYYLRQDVFWQDGLQYNASDAEFSLEFLRDNEIPKYAPAWQNIIDVEVIDEFTFTVHADVTSQFLIYDWASLAAMLPPQVWADWDGASLDQILGRDLSAEDGWNGVTPTNLIGTGPFVFDFWNWEQEPYCDLMANENYFRTADSIQEQKVEMFHRIGDVNRDGIIDIWDLATAGVAYGSRIGEPSYDPDADLNQDGIIDMRDISFIAFFYGEQREYP